jgi:hypothetical protein
MLMPAILQATSHAAPPLMPPPFSLSRQIRFVAFAGQRRMKATAADISPPPLAACHAMRCFRHYFRCMAAIELSQRQRRHY